MSLACRDTLYLRKLPDGCSDLRLLNNRHVGYGEKFALDATSDDIDLEFNEPTRAWWQWIISFILTDPMSHNNKFFNEYKRRLSEENKNFISNFYSSKIEDEIVATKKFGGSVEEKKSLHVRLKKIIETEIIGMNYHLQLAISHAINGLSKKGFYIRCLKISGECHQRNAPQFLCDFNFIVSK
ncbi:MAG: hypothetical protein WC688_04960 [Parachlamydiales bacterium]|jgi:hypothetical protein